MIGRIQSFLLGDMGGLGEILVFGVDFCVSSNCAAFVGL